jgi:hypothetical protein
MSAHNTEITGNPVAISRRIYETIVSYQVTLRSRGSNFSEEIRYYYKSGCIRMEFIQPFRGAVLTYDPTRKEVRLKPLRMLNRVISLSPDSHVIQSSAGHRIDESDIGSLLRAVARLQANGRTCVAGEKFLSAREIIFVRVTGNDAAAVCGVHSYDLWLDKGSYLPLKVVSYDLKDGLIEEVIMDDLKTDVDLADCLFHL